MPMLANDKILLQLAFLPPRSVHQIEFMFIRYFIIIINFQQIALIPILTVV